jgi:hypothetical protein
MCCWLRIKLGQKQIVIRFRDEPIDVIRILHEPVRYMTQISYDPYFSCEAYQCIWWARKQTDFMGSAASWGIAKRIFPISRAAFSFVFKRAAIYGFSQTGADFCCHFIFCTTCSVAWLVQSPESDAGILLWVGYETRVNTLYCERVSLEERAMVVPEHPASIQLFGSDVLSKKHSPLLLLPRTTMLIGIVQVWRLCIPVFTTKANEVARCTEYIMRNAVGSRQSNANQTKRWNFDWFHRFRSGEGQSWHFVSSFTAIHTYAGACGARDRLIHITTNSSWALSHLEIFPGRTAERYTLCPETSNLGSACS